MKRLSSGAANLSTFDERKCPAMAREASRISVPFEHKIIRALLLTQFRLQSGKCVSFNNDGGHKKATQRPDNKKQNKFSVSRFALLTRLVGRLRKIRKEEPANTKIPRGVFVSSLKIVFHAFRSSSGLTETKSQTKGRMT